MRLLKLEMRNFRGARSDLSIELNGQNMIILGPNGTGKSTVVDAIDFLLSGSIDRLLGEGTGGVTLQKHGPHIDANPEDAWVRATVSLPGISRPVKLKRSLHSPNKLLFNRKFAAQIDPIVALARNGQNILTRREVLRYITAPPSRRADRIQALLGISEIERVRGALVRVRGLADKEAAATRRALQSARSALAATIGAAKFDRRRLLDCINENRALLNADPLGALIVSDVRSGIDLSMANQGDKAINPDLLDRDINNIHQQLFPESREQLLSKEKTLRQSIRRVRHNPALNKALHAHKLTGLGLELIDETGDCPLCDTHWPPGKLREQLRAKLKVAEEAHKIFHTISSNADSLADAVRITISSIGKIAEAAAEIGDEKAASILLAWHTRLTQLLDALHEPAAQYLALPYSGEQIASLLVDSPSLAVVEDVQNQIRESAAEVPEKQTAYDLLIRLAAELENWEKVTDADNVAQLTFQRALGLVNAFENSRDHVLSTLYNQVRDRFQMLYREMHVSDEGKFAAVLEPEGAGVSFEVDYHGRGRFPPNAVHSEGHQDSMGVCLFLALAEFINQGKLELVVLDDVLMAIDVGHRRAFSRLLRNEFPERQFLITTHDRLWANQLKHQGLVTSKGFLEISHWDLDNGPRISSESDLWSKIERDLANNDIPAAAARLRRGSEEFYGQVCHSLKARVRYDMTGHYDLGDFLDAAKSRYKELLKKASVSAKSWDNEKQVERMRELETQRQELFTQLDMEQWAVNPAVHYNNWASFNVTDFQPVVDAFQRLQTLFVCQNCHGMIRLINTRPRSVRCNCNQLNWNLENRSSSL